MDLFMTSNTDYEEEQKQKKLEQESHLTPRQWALWRLVEYNSIVLLRKTTQREIYEKVNGYEWNNDDKCHDHCPAIWHDIAANNLSMEHQKIIISNNFEYWIGNEEETKDFIDDLWKQLAPRLYRYWAYKNKGKYNGQVRLFDKNLNPIEDGGARAFIESYNPNPVESEYKHD